MTTTEITRPATPLEMRLESAIVKLEELLRETSCQRFVFRKLLKEALDNRIDDEWLKRVEKALSENT